MRENERMLAMDACTLDERIFTCFGEFGECLLDTKLDTKLDAKLDTKLDAKQVYKRYLQMLPNDNNIILYLIIS